MSNCWPIFKSNYFMNSYAKQTLTDLSVRHLKIHSIRKINFYLIKYFIKEDFKLTFSKREKT